MRARTISDFDPQPAATPQCKRRWARWLVPSFSDCLFGSLVVWLFAAREGWKSLLADGDTGWHIRAGEFILKTRSVPAHDLFSFSRAGDPWFAWEWLSDVLFAVLHRQWGLKGVVLLAGLAIALTAIVVFRHMLWKGANVFVALAVVLVATGASSIHFLARPHVFSLLFLAVSLWILDRDRRSPDRAVWILVPLTSVWTNLHGGFLALLACLGLTVVGSVAETWMNREGGSGRWAGTRRYSLLSLACAAASLVNPYGIRLHLHIAQYLRSDWIREAVDEFQSPKFRSENLLQFEVLLFTALLLAGLPLARRQVTGALLILAWAHLSLSSVRHVPVFAVVSGPVVAAELTRLWELWRVRSSPRSLMETLSEVAGDLGGAFRRTSIWAAVLAAGIVCLGPSSQWPRDFPKEKFPAGLVRRHAARLAGARVFTSDQWADYLIYKGWPLQKVFMDGRSDFYGPVLGKEYMAIAHGRPEWGQLIRRYEFDLVLAPRDWALTALLRASPDWRAVDENPQAVLFGRRPNRLMKSSSPPDRRGGGPTG